MSKHVFISYVREDAIIVGRLASELRSAGIRVWLDKDSLPPGIRWETAIRNAIKEGAFFLCCISENYVKRDRTYMNEELTIAIEELRLRPREKAWFLPVLLDTASVPERSIGGGETLQSIHHLDLSNDWSAGVQRLVTTIDPSTHRSAETDALQAVRARAKQLIAGDLDSEEYPSEAMRELESFGSGILDELIEGLQYDDYDVQWRCVTLLGKIGRPAYPAVPKLIDGIKESMRWSQFTASYVWQYSVDALGKIGDPRAIPILLDLLKRDDIEDWRIELCVAPAVIQLKTHARRELQSAFQSANGVARVRLARVLLETGDDSERTASLQVLQDASLALDERARKAARDVLDRLSRHSQPDGRP